MTAKTDPSTAQAPNASVTGDLRIHEFRSKIYRNTRKLRIWVPPGYSDQGNAQRYPVLYLNDGQNLFDRATAFAGVEWQVDETADRLIRERKIPPLIIVGIDNTGPERMKEYVPWRSFSPPILRPLGRSYPVFLLREVMPFVEREYRTAKGPSHTGLGGSSLGALIAFYTATEEPGVFGRLLLESPSLQMSNRQALKVARKIRDWPERIFLAMGTSETGNPDRDRLIVRDAQEFGQILRRAGLGENRLRMRIAEGGSHGEAAWASRFPEALEFLFH
jgi:predicted alpha/beta superfamily hydrolase